MLGTASAHKSVRPTKDQTAAALVNCHAVLSMVPERSVQIALNSDTPSPQCVLVRPDQRLLMINPRSTAARLTLGRTHLAVAAHSQATIRVADALSRPGGYLLHVGGTNYLQGAVNIGVVVHSP